ncbi:DNA topoisomerase [Glomus cerebriforme]|uniref:DNA topoisomerase (ATP-hydrolyzing) n=1 Tax=Glomus cerebriforme TaxID=658196 RepID=A0A397TA68_9GLOM|nr:DNA topoisomerase [Glomus cerebriforme]
MERVKSITKLYDANNAAVEMLDSAKSLAVAGLSEVGREYYGVFPLKLLNVREGSHAQIMNNTEIQHTGKEYESTRELHYGHLMIMADQDHDGSHTKD